MSRKRLYLLLSTILMAFVTAVSGCITINIGVPAPTPTPTLTPTYLPTPISTPTPTPTSEPTATPSPTPTPIPVDNIVGLWETYYKSVYGSIEFFQNGTSILNEGGVIYSGDWTKINDGHYVIDTSKSVSKGSVSIILNNDMNTLYFGDTGITFVKKMTPSPTPILSPTQQPVVTPTSTPTSKPLDNIVGFWEGSSNSVNYSIEFFQDETLTYDNGGNLATGWWKKKIIHNINLLY